MGTKTVTELEARLEAVYVELHLQLTLNCYKHASIQGLTSQLFDFTFWDSLSLNRKLMFSSSSSLKTRS